MSERKLKAVIGVLATLLFAAVIIALVLFERARLPLYHESDRPLIERSIQKAAREWRTTPREVERLTFPIVMSFGPLRICVELRARSDSGPHGGPVYQACYEGSSQELVEEKM